MNIDANLQLERFVDINLDDPFFDTLKAGYQEFSNWFQRKAEEKAFVMKDEFGMIQLTLSGYGFIFFD